MNEDSPNPYNCCAAQTCPQNNVIFPCSKRTKGHVELGASFREPLGEESRPPTFALATEIHRAIDLSCRACDACGAMAMGTGLGFPVGDSAPLRFHPQPPISLLK